MLLQFCYRLQPVFFIRAEAINHISVYSPTCLHVLPCGLAGCSIGAPPQMARRHQHFPSSITIIPVFPDLASKLNPSLGTPKNAVKPSLAESLMRRRLWSLQQKPGRLTICPPAPKANRLVAGEPMLLRKAFVTPKPLRWTDTLLCPHTQNQNNELSRCTPD